MTTTQPWRDLAWEAAVLHRGAAARLIEWDAQQPANRRPNTPPPATDPASSAP